MFTGENASISPPNNQKIRPYTASDHNFKAKKLSTINPHIPLPQNGHQNDDHGKKKFKNV